MLEELQSLRSKQLGVSPIFLSVIGADEHGKQIQSIMKNNDITSKLIVDPTRPTIYKKRYLVGSQKVFRVSRLSAESITKEVEDTLLDEIDRISGQINGIIVSDFAYGLFAKNE